MSSTFSSSAPWRTYDDEFKYSDEIERNLAQTIQQVENGPKVECSEQLTYEEYFRLHEANVASRKQYRWEHQDELKGGRRGRIMTINRLMLGLLKCGLNAWYADMGILRGTLGLYVGHDGFKKSCKHLFDTPNCNCHVCKGHGHAICMVQPVMQEYEELHFDRYDVPLGPKYRGWRTVLLRLIESGFLTEEQCNKEFGEPQTGPASRRYRSYLKYLRGLK